MTIIKTFFMSYATKPCLHVWPARSLLDRREAVSTPDSDVLPLDRLSQLYVQVQHAREDTHEM